MKTANKNLEDRIRHMQEYPEECSLEPLLPVYTQDTRLPKASLTAEGVPHPFHHHIPPDARFQRKHQEVPEASKSGRKH